MSLITQLKQISDPRHLRGRRHELWVILFLSLLGFLCGYSGYRPLASFCRNHEPSLRLLLSLSDDQPLPSIQPLDAAFFRPHHTHWRIENKLHWVKDVLFNEDDPARRGGHAPVNWAIFNSFAITLARRGGYRTGCPQSLL